MHSYEVDLTDSMFELSIFVMRTIHRSSYVAYMMVHFLRVQEETVKENVKNIIN